MIRFKLDDGPVYAGSKLFTNLSENIGVPLDKLNFLIAQLLAFSLAIIYRSFIRSNIKSVTLKYLIVLIPGFLLGYFAFGYQIWNLWTLGMVCYILIKSCNPNIVQDIVLFVSMFYLSYLHLRRMADSYGSYTLDITAPSMIAVQKITSLAFSVHDGMSDKKSLTREQQRYAITEVPTVLQFFSYLFQFPTFLCGPLFDFNDFIDFIENEKSTDYLIEKNQRLPSYKFVAFKKLCTSFFFLLLLLFVEPMFPISSIADDNFLNNNNMITILFYIFLSTTCARFKYYHAWKLGEAIAITTGFGLIKDDLNELKYISSVDIIGFEFANNFRQCLTSWNTTTQNWLRRISYERCKTNKVTKTYFLSAIWHGFYIGYYMTFLSGALFTNASRVARKHIRPYFQTNKLMRIIYDIMTFLVTKIMLTYIVFPFIILEFTKSYKIYNRLMFSGHIVLILFVIYPVLMKAFGHRESNKQKLN